MTLLVILLGFYLILAIGYFKMLQRSAATLEENIPSVIFGIMSALWPLSMTYTLVREAIK